VAAAGKPFAGKRRVNILALGIDDGQGGQGRSDSILLVHVDTAAHRMSALSIPRDTRIPTGQEHYGKINGAYARGGPRLAAEAVTELTGLPVDYTLSTNFSGFSRLVDLVGGIDMNVERTMDYDDQWGHLSIHLKPGPQHLDGEKAIQYVRFRKSSSGDADGSDISRIGRQQKFLQAVAARCLDGSNLLHLPEIIREGESQIQTDLAAGDLLYLAGLAKEIGAERLKVLTVPGKTAMIGGQSYWLPDFEDMPKVLQQLEGAPSPTIAPVTVAVLNASQCPGLGRRVAGQLQARGYRVSIVATSEAPHASSRVVAANDCAAGAQTIAALLACDCAIGDPAPAEAHDAPVTVIVGRDLAGAKRPT